MINTGLGIPLATTQDEIDANDTLIYNRSGGFAWIRQSRNDDPHDHVMASWNGHFISAAGALAAARNAGFNPTAVYYPREI